MRPKKIDLALPSIRKYFRESEQKAFKRPELRLLMLTWDLPQNFWFKNFLEVLNSKRILKALTIDLNPQQTLFVKPDAGPFQIAAAITGSYFSHYSAAHLHGLTEQIPKTIYVSKEMTNVSVSDEPTQETILKAMEKPPRQTSNVAKLKDGKVCLLTASRNHRVGLEDLQVNEDVYRCTNLERTLIDCVVRPHYSGGVFEVLKFFGNSSDKISVNRIIALLRKLEYSYPYHQAIGFYLTRAGGFKPEAVERLKRFGMKHDFFLCNGIKKSDALYCEDWKLYYPKWLGGDE